MTKYGDGESRSYNRENKRETLMMVHSGRK